MLCNTRPELLTEEKEMRKKRKSAREREGGMKPKGNISVANGCVCRHIKLCVGSTQLRRTRFLSLEPLATSLTFDPDTLDQHKREFNVNLLFILPSDTNT